MVKKGDTLIEVTLAVGIFSMVAVSIVTVLSNDTSDAQTALETTLAREEINTQAEALRFIQSAYIAGRDSADDTSKLYNDLWKEITGRAVNTGDYDISDEELASYTNYSPISCAELYDDNSQASKGFVINPRILSSGINNPEDIEKIVIPNKEIQSEPPLIQAVTYPRLIYDGDTNASLIGESSSINNQLNKAEGIYIIAVKDAKTTQINGEDTAAFYDFYIRTCWYASNSDQPLTVSTVIRLYDPEALPAITVKPKPVCNNNAMQCFDPSRATSDTLSLKDIRDNNVYTAAKIGDLWWMTQNLRTKGTITSEYSNYTGEDYNVCVKGFESKMTDTTNVPRCVDSEDATSGVWYNYKAVSLNGDGSICPKGWRLPNLDEIRAVANGDNTSFSPTTGGYYNKNGELANTDSGYWWSSARNGAFYYQALGFLGDKDTLYVESVADRLTGRYVRCVKSE